MTVKTSEVLSFLDSSNVLTIFGNIPSLDSCPIMVNVLPDPVWPYAKIVKFSPLRDSKT